MIVSGGAVVETRHVSLEAGYWSGSSALYGGTVSAQAPSLNDRSSDDWQRYARAIYGEMYRRHNWVYTVVDYRAHAVARLPVKVFRRNVDGRVDERDHPYARLLQRPSPVMDKNLFWRTVCTHYDLFGEVIIVKLRGADGLPDELHPVHPSQVEIDLDGGSLTYRFVSTSGVTTLPAADVVHIRSVDPDAGVRGVSALEPLRRTLENEDAARTAQASFWRNGARPGVALVHPGQLSQQAIDRLKAQFDAIAAGASKTGTTVVLEEGLKPEVLTVTAEEAQYIQTRELNAVEVVAAYHLPPTAVGILTHATYSNVTEQLRSVYRDTVAPLLQMMEAALDAQLRPDFAPDGEVYAEFVLDEVLRGSFEDRVQALAAAINSAQITPAEARQLENRPYVDGSDKLLINAAAVPVAAVEPEMLRMLLELVRAGYVPDEAATALGLPVIKHSGNYPQPRAAAPTTEVRSDNDG